MVGAPGTGKTTALSELWRYIHDHLDELVTELPVDSSDQGLQQMIERIRHSLVPEKQLTFTFDLTGEHELRIVLL
jgi:broad-specificity NMP kinase